MFYRAPKQKMLTTNRLTKIRESNDLKASCNNNIRKNFSLFFFPRYNSAGKRGGGGGGVGGGGKKKLLKKKNGKKNKKKKRGKKQRFHGFFPPG
jgi:hypothetical protein